MDRKSFKKTAFSGSCGRGVTRGAGDALWGEPAVVSEGMATCGEDAIVSVMLGLREAGGCVSGMLKLVAILDSCEDDPLASASARLPFLGTGADAEAEIDWVSGPTPRETAVDAEARSWPGGAMSACSAYRYLSFSPRTRSPSIWICTTRTPSQRRASDAAAVGPLTRKCQFHALDRP